MIINSAAAANLVMLGAGYFTPLEGFMGKNEVISVADNMKLDNGLFWPTPVVNLTHQKVDFKEGDKVTMKQGGEEMEVVGIRKMFGNNTKVYKVKKANGEEVEYSANQLKKVMSPEEKANVFVR